MRRRDRPGRMLLPALTLAVFAASAPAAAQPVPVGGRVLTEAGSPLPGARVELLPARGRLERGLEDLAGALPDPAVVAASDRDGSFSLLAPAPGMWMVRVSAPGRVAMQRHLHPLLEELELPAVTLLPDGGVAVTVTDGEGGALPGFGVEATPPEGGEPWSEAWEEGRWWPARRRAWSDEEGHARLPRAPGEEVEVAAFAPLWLEAAGGRSRGEPVRLVPGIGSPRRLQVQDLRGRPVAGAVVRVGEWAAAMTDESGTARVVLPPGEEPAVALDLPAGWRYRLTLPPAGAEGGEGGEDPLVVRLPPPLRVRGRVVDSESHEPLAGALVWLEGDGREAVTTGRGGGFELAAAPTGEPAIRLDVAAPGHVPGRWGWEPEVDDGREVTLELAPALTVFGVVVEEGGAPVAGAEVRLRRESSGWRSWRQQGVRVETAAADGRFRFGSVRAQGVYEVRAAAPGLAPATARVDREAARRGIELVLGRGAAVVGRVVDEGRRPLPGARLRLFEAPPERAHLSRFRAGETEADFEAAADTEGWFEIPHLSTGRFELEAASPGFATTRVPGVEPAAEGEVVDLGEIVLEAGAGVEGRTVDERGEPVAGVRIRAEAQRTQRYWGGLAPRLGGRIPAVMSDGDGRFELRDLHPGERLALHASKEGYMDSTADGVEAPTGEPVLLVLGRGGRIFGTVEDAAGRPLAGARVRAVAVEEERRPDGSLYARSSRGYSEQADAEGRFGFDSLPPAEVELTASAPGFVVRQVGGLRVAGGEEVGPLRIVLERGGVVEGRVLDPWGRPARRAVVSLSPREPGRGSGASQQVRADADGHFRFLGGLLGAVRIAARDEGGGRAEEMLEVGPGGIRVDLVLELRPAISGRVLSPSGEPVGEAMVQLEHLPQEGGSTSRSTSSQYTRPDGSFLYADLAPGSYRLKASKPGWAETPLEGVLTLGDLPIEGVEIRLTRGAAIVGLLSGVEAEVLGRVAVQTAPVAGGRPLVGSVDFQGGYRIEGVAPGEWRVSAVAPDGRTARGQVTVAAGDGEVRLDLDLGRGLTLTGRVTLDGEPVAGLQLHLSGAGTRISGTATGRDGSFRLAGLDPGRWVLQGEESRSGLRVWREIDLGSDAELQIDLFATTVRGRVLTAGGAPAAGARVALQPLGVQGVLARPYTTVVDAEGRFARAPLPAGRYRLSIDAGEGGRLTVEIDVAGTELVLGDLVLQAPGAAEE